MTSLVTGSEYPASEGARPPSRGRGHLKEGDHGEQGHSGGFGRPYSGTGEGWAKLRERACLLYISRSIEGADVLTVREAVAGLDGEPLDVIIASPGGHASVAYVVARELRRRWPEVTAVVPLRAKSAATLLCLACDEIIPSSLGELGPLDEQVNEKQTADFPAHTSRLVPFKALAQFQTAALDTFDAAVNRILGQSGMRPLCG